MAATSDEDMVKMTEENFEKSLLSSQKTGISMGLAQAANHLMGKAKDMFAINNDTYALQLRGLAQEIGKMRDGV